MKYTVLLFDADGMLFDFHQAEQIAFKTMLEDHNLTDINGDYFSVYIKENKVIWSELEQGLISQDELKIERFRRFLSSAAIDGVADSFASSFMNHLSHASILYDGALDMIKYLSDYYTIAIITNGLKEVQTRRIRESVLAPYVECTVISDELGIAKPNPEIIDYTLNKLNHSKHDDVLIIGDSLTSDIQGGINAKIDTCWYNPNHSTNALNIQPTYEVHTYEELLELLNKAQQG